MALGTPRGIDDAHVTSRHAGAVDRDEPRLYTQFLVTSPAWTWKDVSGAAPSVPVKDTFVNTHTHADPPRHTLIGTHILTNTPLTGTALTGTFP